LGEGCHSLFSCKDEVSFAYHLVRIQGLDYATAPLLHIPDSQDQLGFFSDGGRSKEQANLVHY
jgi:hypothetical protein